MPSDRATYATIFVKPSALIASRGNASTPTEPTKRCIVTFRLSVRNGKYKDRSLNCQARPRSGSVRNLKILCASSAYSASPRWFSCSNIHSQDAEVAEVSQRQTEIATRPEVTALEVLAAGQRHDELLANCLIQKAALNKCQTPHPIAPNTDSSASMAAKTASLNFR